MDAILVGGMAFPFWRKVYVMNWISIVRTSISANITGSGRITYFHYILEAKLVTSDGHALGKRMDWGSGRGFRQAGLWTKSLWATCSKTKKTIPSFASLYSGRRIVSLQKRIQNLWGQRIEIYLRPAERLAENSTGRIDPEQDQETGGWILHNKKGWRITDEYRYQTGIEYHKKYTLNWVQCIETPNKLKH